MKRFALVLLLSMIVLFQLPSVPVKVLAMKGPTAMGLTNLMDRAQKGSVNGNEYEFTLESSPDAAVPKIVRGSVDIAAIPANLASTLYNRTSGKIEVLGINTLGVLYIVENGSTVKSVEDLRGRTIYASGKGATPEYTLLYILENAGLEPGKDVFIEWKSEHAECVAAIVADRASVALIPEPFATSAAFANPNVRVALDLNEIWRSLTGLELITGVTVVRKDFLIENEDAVNRFLDDYEESVRYANEDPGAPYSIESYGIISAEVASAAIDKCNIVLITGEGMKNSLSFYLETLNEQNPNIIGGGIPGDDFYYTRKNP